MFKFWGSECCFCMYRCSVTSLIKVSRVSLFNDCSIELKTQHCSQVSFVYNSLSKEDRCESLKQTKQNPAESSFVVKIPLQLIFHMWQAHHKLLQLNLGLHTPQDNLYVGTKQNFYTTTKGDNQIYNWYQMNFNFFIFTA